jgi:hypothetical protein
MINVSSAMGGQFAFSVAELTAEIKQMGPNPLKQASGDGQQATGGRQQTTGK